MCLARYSDAAETHISEMQRKTTKKTTMQHRISEPPNLPFHSSNAMLLYGIYNEQPTRSR